jgi:hypothetical protein
MRTPTRWTIFWAALFVFFTTIAVAARAEQDRRKTTDTRVQSQVVIGQFAPDFNVPRLRLSTSNQGQPIGTLDVKNPFHLASLRGKRPVCLIMSSYT